MSPSSGDPSVTHDASERPSVDETSYRALEAAVHAAAREQSADLAARWEAQIKSVALMSETRTRHADEGEAARCLLAALLGALAAEGDESEEAIAHGLRFGTDAFAQGTSLHHTMKALDLLLAMTMYAIERSIDELGGGHGSVAHGIRLSRALQRRAALLSLAATRGYMQAYAEALRERFRHLRHDLRNPLGTIKSVLSLMDDETVPDARSDPRFQAMAKRNARSLEDLIADRLSDAAALLPVVAGQDVSLRSIVCGVRREMRGETERHGVTIFVGPVAPYGRLDSPALELVLRGALEAVLQDSVEGDQLHVEFGDAAGDRATVIISCESGRAPIRDAASLGRLTTLARQMGATLAAGDTLLVSVPMRASDDGASDHERELPRDPVSLGDGETRDDVRGARQRDHGKAGTL